MTKIRSDIVPQPDLNYQQGFVMSTKSEGPEIRSVISGMNHKIYIYGQIESPTDYVEAVSLLDNATENDVIDIHIATPGGDIDAAIVLIHAIRRCRGHVVGHADAQVISAGVPIFLSCAAFAINPFSTFMVHDGAFGSYQKVNEHLKFAMATTQLFEKLYRDVLHPVFSHDEIGEIMQGKDIYVDADDMLERIQNSMSIEEENTNVEEIQE